ncbi:MAG: hypothetical protein CMN74_03685 [Sphingorhabdus sp.]|nr:hypothetical protein [Sphingorhabdus sp.]|tara:strand:- start:255 stop:1106 length:852 start_codon:yes stop_codon:yes gene_type:complete
MQTPTNVSTKTAYEQKKSITRGEATEIFDKHFAIGAFKIAQRSNQTLSSTIKKNIRKFGHKDLAKYCMAYLMAVETKPKKPENAEFLRLIREIRDGSKAIAQAADALTHQMVQHEIKTGQSEPLRFQALYDLADALNRSFHFTLHEDEYDAVITPRRISHAIASYHGTHGLKGCSSLYNKAIHIINENSVKSDTRDKRGSSDKGMKPGAKVNRDLMQFIRDLGDVYRKVSNKTPAAANNEDKPVPFVRFVHYVFEGILTESDFLGEPRNFGLPSPHVIRTALK